MQLRKRVSIPTIVIVAVAIWVSRQQHIVTLQRTLEETKKTLVEASNRLETATLELAASRERLRQQEENHRETSAALKKSEQELSILSPESRWATLPAELPHWDSESPYVWVSKDIAKEVRSEPFGPDGSLLPQAAFVLVITPAQMQQLNATLPKLLAEYRELESGNVRLTDEHLPGNSEDGTAITVSWLPLPEEGARLKSQFEAVLRDVLGEQRTELLLASDDGNLETEFGQLRRDSETEQKITLVRHANNSFNISVRRGHNWLSTAAPYAYRQNLDHHIPKHFRPFFAELLDAPEQ